MNAQTLHRILLACLSCITLFVAAAAHAGLFRAYVSQAGNDANPCTLAQPCRLLPAALAAINSGGEIWMVDSANYNTAPVSIAKSVTILAIPGALGSVVANGGDAIDIAAPGIQVTLRNLVVLNFSGGAHGINFSQGAFLLVEECEIYGLPQDGIHFTGPGTLTVKNTAIHSVAGAGIFLANAGAAIERVTLTELTTGLSVGTGAFASLTSSLIHNANTGVVVAESGGGGSRLTIDNSIIRQTSTAVSAASTAAPDIVRVTIARSTIANNLTGISAQGTNAFVTLDNDVIQHHSTASINISGGTVFTRGNNTMNFFSIGVVGGSLTPLSGV